jgi:integrase
MPARRPPAHSLPARLGHATVAMTLGIYSHAIPAMQEEAAALIAGLVFAGK